MAESLSELCHRDVKSIQTCAECFEYWAIDPNDYFAKVCTKPHLIVYAKAHGFPYWPAKVLAINNRLANVAFFGEHTQADVPIKNCILYTKRNPVQNIRPTAFNNALKVNDTLGFMTFFFSTNRICLFISLNQLNHFWSRS